MDIEQIRAPIADDMRAVNALIRRQLHSDVVLINQLAGYIIDSGGKRLRPAPVPAPARADAVPPRLGVTRDDRPAGDGRAIASRAGEAP